MRQLSKFLPARAAVASFSRVNSGVTFQLPSGFERRPAPVARERPLSRVNPRVHGELAFRDELPVALVTEEDVFPGVEPLVPRETVSASEGLLALLARKRPLPYVNEAVLF